MYTATRPWAATAFYIILTSLPWKATRLIFSSQRLSREKLKYLCKRTARSTSQRDSRTDQLSAISTHEAMVPRKIEPAQICGYLQRCEEGYNHSRLDDNRLYHTRINLILIDVIEGRLVRGSSRDRYFALSYVWGDVPMFKQPCQTGHPSRSLDPSQILPGKSHKLSKTQLHLRKWWESATCGLIVWYKSYLVVMWRFYS